MHSLGLRERKKQRTRETIVEAAFRLFRERGYDETTVADIAAAADIAPRTFFGYFAAKEDVVFHDLDAVVEELALRLRDRPPGETTFDALRAWILDHANEHDHAGEDERFRRELIRATPALQARERLNLSRFERLLAEGAARDLGTEPDTLQAHLVGAAAIATLEAIGRFYDREGAAKPPADEAAAIIDEALVFLRGGLDALTGRTSGRSRRA